MSMDAEDGAKREYEKPSLRTLSLVAQEVMAVGCKMPSSNGPLGGSPGTTCLVPAGPCVQITNAS